MGAAIRPGGARFMSESLDSELAALREAMARFPVNDRPWPVIAEALINKENGALPADRVDDALRWTELDQHIGPIAGQRVLVIGGDVAYDAGAFEVRGASYVAAFRASNALDSPSRHGSTNGSTVDFRQLDWSELDPASYGCFDLVHCNDLLHRVLEPTSLLRNLRRMLVPGGTLLIASMVLADPERSEYLRFIPDHHAGDSTWWFVPGRLALRWLLQTAGFEVQEEFGEREGPRDRFPVISGYFRAVASE
jgi:SAM-dependent methyltransferase